VNTVNDVMMIYNVEQFAIWEVELCVEDLQGLNQVLMIYKVEQRNFMFRFTQCGEDLLNRTV
jgi:hypothetical protein